MPIEIYTWKSGSKGVGFSKPVKSILLGGNVGHAAIELTFPADAKGNELAKKYQDVPGLSISKRTEIVPEKKADGNYAPKEQVSYFVYFSWWPGHTNGHHINSHRDDLEAEWRHEPSQKIKPHAHDHIFGDEVPEKNKTNVTGAFIREKTITKIKEISHTVLQKNIGDDPAYKELKAEETALKNELEQLKNKLEIYKDEVLNARRENREPNKDLDLNEAENVRYHEINKDIRRIDAQIKLCQIDFEERHLSVGERPSSVIRISTSNDHNAPAFALDAENVLDKMASLAQSNSAYSFYKFNCSTTATEVLKAGISNELKSTMKADGFNVENASKATISTPTSFSNFGRQLQTELIHLNTKNSTLELDTTAAAATTVARISEISTLTTQSFKERFQHAVKERDKTIDIDEDHNSNLSFSMD